MIEIRSVKTFQVRACFDTDGSVSIISSASASARSLVKVKLKLIIYLILC